MLLFNRLVQLTKEKDVIVSALKKSNSGLIQVQDISISALPLLCVMVLELVVFNYIRLACPLKMYYTDSQAFVFMFNGGNQYGSAISLIVTRICMVYLYY